MIEILKTIILIIYDTELTLLIPKKLISIDDEQYKAKEGSLLKYTRLDEGGNK